MENEEEGEEEGEDEATHSDVTKDLATDESIIDPVEERRTLAERNERLHDQLKVNDTLVSTLLYPDKCSLVFHN